MATINGKQVSWSMEALDGTMIQSADASLAYDTKDYAGAEGNTESIVEYNEKVEFSVNAVMLDGSDTNTVLATVRTWCESQATSLFGLESGGSTLISEYKISEAIDDAKTVDITCTYYPYAKASA